MDRLTPTARRRLMQSVGTRDTAPERAVRSILHRAGFRFALHRRDLPGTPDIVLPKYGAVVFVHGCFWHGHRCRWGRLPKSRQDYWAPKIEGNRARDLRNRRALVRLGWRCATVWQCELRNPQRLATRLEAFLKRSA